MHYYDAYFLFSQISGWNKLSQTTSSECLDLVPQRLQHCVVLIWIALLFSILKSCLSLSLGWGLFGALLVMAMKARVEAVLNVGLRIPSIMLLEVLYRWDVSSFFQKIQRSSLNNNPLFQYKYIALYLHYVGRSKHNKQPLPVYTTSTEWHWTGNALQKNSLKSEFS